jgi:uncharacterized protein YkwD
MKKYLAPLIFLLSLGCFLAIEKPLDLIKNESANKETDVTDYQKRLLELHNQERTSRGYEPLKINNKLCDYAEKHAEFMTEKESLTHSRMSDLSKASGASSVGENIAWGQKDEASVVSSWMWSPLHRWNILGSSYKQVGFGMKKDKNGRIYWCTVFSN